eukprot:8439199-Pyramimonas_sp.AAC.2
MTNIKPSRRSRTRLVAPPRRRGPRWQGVVYRARARPRAGLRAGVLWASALNLARLDTTLQGPIGPPPLPYPPCTPPGPLTWGLMVAQDEGSLVGHTTPYY